MVRFSIIVGANIYTKKLSIPNRLGGSLPTLEKLGACTQSVTKQPFAWDH